MQRPVYRKLLKMMLEEMQLIEQITELDQKMASLLRQHQDAVERLAEVPGLGVDSAQQIIAEVDLVDPARRSPLPGTRSSGEQTSKGTARMIGQLRNLGYRIEPPQLQNLSSA